MSLVLESWPSSVYDAVKLPDGRAIGAVPSGELSALLSDYGVPGCSTENGRATNVEAYAQHLRAINAKSGSEGMARWLNEAKRRVSPQAITFRQTEQGVVIIGGWPSKALIGETLISDPPPYMAVNGHVVTFGVVNGFASYRKRSEVEGGWYCIIGEHEYIATQESSERQ